MPVMIRLVAHPRVVVCSAAMQAIDPANSKKAAGQCAAAFEAAGKCLFGGDFARRVERAGIVDLRHLMIAEAEHLPQDLVGVFAEQG